jgi:hypothetical protein
MIQHLMNRRRLQALVIVHRNRDAGAAGTDVVRHHLGDFEPDACK